MIVLVINFNFLFLLVNDFVITDDPPSNYYNYLGGKYVQCIFLTKS